MRKGIVNNERDYNILQHLYYGPSVISVIFSSFFATDVKNEKRKKTRWRVMLRRLQKMQEARLIEFVTDNRTDERILILAQKGSDLACNVFSLQIENAWIHAGKDYYHDLTTAEIARNFSLNANDELDVNIEFEFYLKKEQQREMGNVRGLGFPDFRVYLKRKNAETKIYDVERDCSTISKHAYEKKLRSAHYPLLIVTDTIQRVNWLFKHARELQVRRRVFITRIKQLPKNIYSPFKCWSPPNPDPITMKICGDEVGC